MEQQLGEKKVFPVLESGAVGAAAVRMLFHQEAASLWGLHDGAEKRLYCLQAL